MQHIDGDAQAMAEDMRVGCLGLRIARTHRLVTRIFEQALRPLGLTLPQLELLSTLTIVGRPIKPTELADLTAVERSTTSRNLAVMQARGWVATADVSPTGRAMAISITTAGSRQLAEARTAWELAQDRTHRALGPDAAPVLDQWIRELLPTAPGATPAP